MIGWPFEKLGRQSPLWTGKWRRRAALVGSVSLLGAIGPIWLATAAADVSNPAGVWTLKTLNAPSGRDAGAWDASRHQAVVWSGQDTWTGTPGSWSRLAGSTHPDGVAVTGTAMAYFPPTGKVVQFGGRTASGAAVNATWNWDGSQWTSASPVTSPGPRWGAALGYDPISQRLILFGGTRNPTALIDCNLYDTWAWDGTTWTQLTPSTVPTHDSPQMYCDSQWSSAFDYDTGELMLTFAGYGVTWEWNGSDWHSIASIPMGGNYSLGSVRAVHSVVACCHTNDSERYSLWDGTTWTNVTATAADPQWARVLISDVDDNVIIDLSEQTSVNGATRYPEYDWVPANGATVGTWSVDVTASDTSSPIGATADEAAVDASTGATIMYDDTDGSTWTWYGELWHRWDTSMGLSSTAIAFDPATDQLLMFGGLRQSSSGPSESGQTYAWDDVQHAWDLLSPAVSPSPRFGASLVFDAGLDELVLYGGRNSETGDLTDTFTWDGSVWTQVPTLTAPSAREFPTTAWDSISGDVLLFGGRGSNGGLLNDTWSFDGADWRQLNPAHRPPPTSEATASALGGLNGIIVYGGVVDASGLVSSTKSNATYLWDGADWTQNRTPGGPQTPTPGVWVEGPTRDSVSLVSGPGPMWTFTLAPCANTTSPSAIQACADNAGTPSDPGDLTPPVGPSLAPTAECVIESTVSFEENQLVPGGSALCNQEQLQAFTDTPRGYTIQGGEPKDDYNYYIPTKYAYILDCDGYGCKATSKVQENFHEHIYGGSSTRWSLTMSNKWLFGRHFEAFYDYYCGVNISGATDQTCDTWTRCDGADSSAHGTISEVGYGGNVTLNKNMGSKPHKKFPMFNDRIQWDNNLRNISDDGSWGLKIRGWDVCENSTDTLLCSTTGQGG